MLYYTTIICNNQVRNYSMIFCKSFYKKFIKSIDISDIGVYNNHVA